MTEPNHPQGWGPSPPGKPHKSRWWQVVLFFVLLSVSVQKAVILLSVALLVRVWWDTRARRARRRARSTGLAAGMGLAATRAKVAAEGGSAFLGVTDGGGWRLARPQRAVLLLGPPRSGKSSGLIIPTVLSCPGPVVSTSTKPDILAATARARSQVGRVWEFDPTGGRVSSGRSLRWSPVTCASSWDGALMMARAMVTGTGVGAGTLDGTHWSKRAAALLAALLHAAALGGAEISAVVDWVACHELDGPGSLLQKHDARLAASSLTGLANTEARERSSIFSAAADALEAYTGHGALAAATAPNFDAVQFVGSTDCIYIHAPAEHQAMAAPLVCGLLAEIRRATYRAHACGGLRHSVLFALDEAANIAPLAELPQIASEGGGQGLSLIASFQDLSQARHRWGPLADGFLTLFGEKLILPGIAEPSTLEAVSLALGEYDRTIVSSTRNPGSSGMAVLFGAGVSRTTSIQRQRVLSPGEIANVPAGRGLHLDGLDWELLTLVNAHRDQPWKALTQTVQDTAASVARSGR